MQISIIAKTITIYKKALKNLSYCNSILKGYEYSYKIKDYKIEGSTQYYIKPIKDRLIDYKVIDYIQNEHIQNEFYF